MPVIRDDVDPELFRIVVGRNMIAQRHLLRTLVMIGLRSSGFGITPEVVSLLHRAALTFLIQTPGEYRDHAVMIADSPHEPPSFDKVLGHMNEYFKYLRENWNTASPYHLAAYGLWRLYWIHPFEDGNSRTSRAVSYLILCLKHGRWLAGRNTIFEQIKRNPKPSKTAIRLADARYDKDKKMINVSELERYLERALTRQLQSR